MFFIFKWWAKLKHGSEAVEEFERKQREPKPIRRAPVKVKRRRIKK